MIGSENPKDYITEKRPKTDFHDAFLTQDMPMITLLSPEFWCCWFILKVVESCNCCEWTWLKHVCKHIMATE